MQRMVRIQFKHKIRLMTTRSELRVCCSILDICPPRLLSFPIILSHVFCNITSNGLDSSDKMSMTFRKRVAGC